MKFVQKFYKLTFLQNFIKKNTTKMIIIIIVIIIIITPQGLPTWEYGCGNPEVPSCVSLCFFLSWVRHLSFIFPVMVPFLFRPPLLSVSTPPLEPFLMALRSSLGGLMVSTG